MTYSDIYQSRYALDTNQGVLFVRSCMQFDSIIYNKQLRLACRSLLYKVGSMSQEILLWIVVGRGTSRSRRHVNAVVVFSQLSRGIVAV